MPAKPPVEFEALSAEAQMLITIAFTEIYLNLIREAFAQVVGSDKFDVAQNEAMTWYQECQAWNAYQRRLHRQTSHKGKR